MKQETIKIRISDDVKAKFQKLCAMQGKGMSKFLQRLIDFEIEKNAAIIDN